MPGQRRAAWAGSWRRRAAGLAVPVAMAAATACGGSGGDLPDKDGAAVVIGLVTSSEANPFALKMLDGAERASLEYGATLMTAAGRFDGDTASQVTAIETMITSKVHGILVEATADPAVTAALRQARAAGITVIALGSSSDPPSDADAVFGTDDFRAGHVGGEYAKAALGDRTPVVAMLDLAPGSLPGAHRHNGFLAGMKLADVDDGATKAIAAPGVACSEPTYGQQDIAQTVLEECLAANPEVNVVFAIDDEVAAGAHTAALDAGRPDVLIVSADGGCAGVNAVAEGRIAATAQQHPRAMAEQGVAAVVSSVRESEKVTGFHDTGVTLITATPRSGVESADVATGLSDCWG
ncbi:substrate-binding domain-containing protein [Frankia nepalensis]|uniref:substrate-binding domain-containing protein n=1 Tax=Frankia nepalensis TaxID=1836974 RepID=UPI0027DE3175|nr:substrate-binding domain-containing protein [Frankia nepalensis]